METAMGATVEALGRRLRELGWMTPALMPKSEATAAAVLLAKGLAHLVTQDRRDVLRLTDAGRAWAESLS